VIATVLEYKIAENIHWKYQLYSNIHSSSLHILATRLNQPCTIKRHLQEWGFYKRNRIQVTSELGLRIAVIFQMSYADKNIVRQLQRDNLGVLSERRVATIRKKMNMVRRMTV
jgi:hypothetical protein